ncbi:UDP-Glycosyltransferase superfamily protein isoform X2 [Wolffia australiana]
MEVQSRRPRAAFMAFGTKGDAIAASFSCERSDYDVFLISHSAHQSLSKNLEIKGVSFVSVSTPAVLSRNSEDSTEALNERFFMRKENIKEEHRKQCLFAVERIFGDCPPVAGDFILINFFALEGWSLAELFGVDCVVAAPYVVPYSAPSSFEQQFKRELPLLYKLLKEAPPDKVSWNDVTHWMWPLFSEEWGSWRSNSLNLSPYPFTDPVTFLPSLHLLQKSPLLLNWQKKFSRWRKLLSCFCRYGFSNEVVECPGYWPRNVHACGFWFLPAHWQFSCVQCRERLQSQSRHMDMDQELCSTHSTLEKFLKESDPSCALIFVGLSSIGSMGYLRNPRAFLLVLKTVIERSLHRFVLFSLDYEPLDDVIKSMANESDGSGDCTFLFDDRLICFSGNLPYSWIFPRCAAVIHHGGSGSTAAAVVAGVPQVVSPFVLDQFYWAERMHWLGLAPEPLQKGSLAPETDDADTVERGACAVMRAVKLALSPEIKSRASEFAAKVSTEDGIAVALKILEQHVLRPRHEYRYDYIEGMP